MVTKKPKFEAPEKIYIRLGTCDKSQVLSYRRESESTFPDLPPAPISIYTDRQSYASAKYIGFTLQPSRGVFRRYTSTGELFFIDHERREGSYPVGKEIKIRVSELEGLLDGSRISAEVVYEGLGYSKTVREFHSQMLIVDPTQADNWIDFDMSEQRRASVRDLLREREEVALTAVSVSISEFLIRCMTIEEKRKLYRDITEGEQLQQLKNILASNDLAAMEKLHTDAWKLKGLISSLESVERSIEKERWPV